MTHTGKLTPPFTKPQLVKLFDSISTPKVAMACFIAVTHGLRIREVTRIKWSDIDFDNKKLWIMNSKWRHRGRDGYGKDRWCPLHPYVTELLERWKNYVGGGDWVFPSDTQPDEHIRTKSLFEQFKRFQKLADLNHTHLRYERKVKTANGVVQKIINKSVLNFHSFRKFYISNLVKKGVPIPVIASNVGHQDISTTQSYIFLDDSEKMKLTMNALDRPTEIMQLRQQQPEFYQQVAMPQPSLPPISAMEKLKLQFINNEITEEDYVKKLQLLNPEGIKQIVELKSSY